MLTTSQAQTYEKGYHSPAEFLVTFRYTTELTRCAKGTMRGIYIFCRLEFESFHQSEDSRFGSNFHLFSFKIC